MIQRSGGKSSNHATFKTRGDFGSSPIKLGKKNGARRPDYDYADERGVAGPGTGTVRTTTLGNAGNSAGR